MSGIDAFTSLCLHCDGVDGSTSFPDASLSPKTVTAVAPAQVDTAQFVFGNASMLGDGLTSGLTSVDNAGFEFGAGDFTLDCRVRFNAISGPGFFVSKYTTAGAQRCFYWGYDDASASMVFRYSTDGAGSTLLSQSWSPSTATWYHVAVVRNGGNLLMFVDGTQLGAGDAIAGTLFDGTGDLNIGAFNSVTGGWLDGWLDEIRISNGVARWTSNFTPPTQAYSVDTYQVAWISA